MVLRLIVTFIHYGLLSDDYLKVSVILTILIIFVFFTRDDE